MERRRTSDGVSGQHEDITKRGIGRRNHEAERG